MRKLITHIAFLSFILLWTCEDKVKLSNLASIQIVVNEAILQPGQSTYFYARGFDKDNNRIDKINVEWSSSDESIISIDAGGKATAISKGIANIIAASSEISASKEIVISNTRRKILSEMFTSST